MRHPEVVIRGLKLKPHLVRVWRGKGWEMVTGIPCFGPLYGSQRLALLGWEIPSVYFKSAKCQKPPSRWPRGTLMSSQEVPCSNLTRCTSRGWPRKWLKTVTEYPSSAVYIWVQDSQSSSSLHLSVYLFILDQQNDPHGNNIICNDSNVKKTI